ncbi:MAG TPA: outer membrane lipoprotein-sorting protein [Fimbriimonadaceae bacterium]|nr:outer membrane lipoprotein-sorting protein [Fimbriimonadaceae bacterium]
MKRRRIRNVVLLAGAIIALGGWSGRSQVDAASILRKGFDNWRSKTSESVVKMTIHRPDWVRSLTMRVWTEGHDKSLVRFTAPAKDAGNGTLTVSGRTWMYTPKLNQIVALPASAMSQSWMGSDFSNDDLSKTESLITDYRSRILSTESAGGHKVYIVEAIPKPAAPVVWGKQLVRVRDDGVFLEEVFYDQDMKAVRTMTTEKVGSIGGRAYPIEIRMAPNGKPGEWTSVETVEAKFDVPLPSYTFTKSNLQNPRG